MPRRRLFDPQPNRDFARGTTPNDVYRNRIGMNTGAAFGGVGGNRKRIKSPYGATAPTMLPGNQTVPSPPAPPPGPLGEPNDLYNQTPPAQPPPLTSGYIVNGQIQATPGSAVDQLNPAWRRTDSGAWVKGDPSTTSQYQAGMRFENGVGWVPNTPDRVGTDQAGRAIYSNDYFSSLTPGSAEHNNWIQTHHYDEGSGQWLEYLPGEIPAYQQGSAFAQGNDPNKPTYGIGQGPNHRPIFNPPPAARGGNQAVPDLINTPPDLLNPRNNPPPQTASYGVPVPDLKNPPADLTDPRAIKPPRNGGGRVPTTTLPEMLSTQNGKPTRGNAPPPPTSSRNIPDDGKLAMPLSPEFEAARRGLEDQLSAELADIGVARREIPAMVALLTKRLETDQGEANRQSAEMANARGASSSSIATNDLNRIGRGFDRERQGIGLDALGQLRELAGRESGAHMGYNRGLSELLMQLANFEATNPRSTANKTGTSTRNRKNKKKKVKRGAK